MCQLDCRLDCIFIIRHSIERAEPRVASRQGQSLDDDRPYDLVRDAAAELGLALTRIEQRRHRIEDLFREPTDGIPGFDGVTAAGSGGAAAGAPTASAGSEAAR